MRTLGRCVVVASITAATFVGAARASGPLNAILVGSAVVPGPGDPDGSGFAAITLNSGQGLVCFDLAVADIAPATAAHIHRAPVGSAGPVAVSLLPPITGSSTGCVSVAKNLIDDISKNPEQYYVDIHNQEFPAGALRGQLQRPGTVTSVTQGNRRTPTPPPTPVPPTNTPTPTPTPYRYGASLNAPPSLNISSLLAGGLALLLVKLPRRRPSS